MFEKTKTKNKTPLVLAAGIGAVATGALVHLRGRKRVTRLSEELEKLQVQNRVIREENTDLRANEMKLNEQSRTDALTGLKNRRAFEDDFNRLTAQRKREGKHGNDHLALIDLDGFKHVNDTHGHPMGDALLITVANKLSGTVRAEDEVARFGGDEFALLLVDPSAPNPQEEEDSAHHVAERVLAVVKEASDELGIERGTALGVTASIGIGVIDPSKPFEYTYGRVDSSLYVAKNGGKAQIAYVPPDPGGSPSV
jgi:diguanylate cyclase (GGDEF)-like protein